VHARICQVEARYDFLQYEVDGWCVWPILRFGVAKVLTNVFTTDRSRLGRVERLSLALRDIPRLMVLKRARYVVKTYPSGLAEPESGLYKDIWFDDLLREIGAYFKIESINNPMFIPRRRVALVKSHMTTTLFDSMSAVLARTVGPPYISKIALRLSSILQSEFGTDAFTPRRVRTKLLYFYWLKKIYTWLLGRVHPEYLLIADPSEYALVAAARERGIKVVELQHGINDRYHSGYSWTAYAVKYKDRMPIPDHLFLYGKHWKRELDVHGFWGDALRVVGGLRVDQYRKLRSATHKDDQCTLVLTTQGIDVEKAIAFTKDFLELASDNLALRLYIKLHPIEETSKEPYLAAFHADRRVQVFLGNEGSSTFELLTRAHFHISISSAAHYDALGLGVATVVLPLTTYETVLPLCEAGHALLARSPHELLDMVLRWKAEKVPEEVSAYYFEPGALENMKRELGVKQ